jgi:carbamoyltransferase
MLVLGISAFYHDSAAALISDGDIIAAAQEERFSRIKHDQSLPLRATAYCLTEAGIELNEIDKVVFYDKPLLTFDRIMETYISFAPRGFGSFVNAIPVWIKQKILQKSLIKKGLNSLDRGRVKDEQIGFCFHHHSHAASAFYPSPFETAAIIVCDGVGEWATTTIGRGRDNRIILDREIRFPHSLGMLYSAFTYYLGFAVNEGEYKVMGLAPYGEPSFVDEIRENLIDVKPDGSYKLDMTFFNYCTGMTMINSRFNELFRGPVRSPDDPLTQRHMDLARSVQVVAEEVMLQLARSAYDQTGERNLCLAGGVALNCVANGRLLREGPFDNIWIQPAAGDAGGAVGAALAALYDGEQIVRAVNSNLPDGMKGSYLGPSFNDSEIEEMLRRRRAVYQRSDDDRLYVDVARVLADGGVVGWFQGRMEFGPRALGNRSILGDARSPRMQRVLNLKIKYRESFRPFAPAVKGERVGEYFDLDRSSPYMLLVANVREDRLRELTNSERALRGIDLLSVARSDLPAITHVDNSARIQTVHRETNPKFYQLIEAFEALTGYAVLVNTSFNVRDEPIVCTPDDAYRCFMGTEMDLLVLGNYVVDKSRQ